MGRLKRFSAAWRPSGAALPIDQLAAHDLAVARLAAAMVWLRAFGGTA